MFPDQLLKQSNRWINIFNCNLFVRIIKDMTQYETPSWYNTDYKHQKLLQGEQL